jgi:hypothetical protein
LNKLKSQLSLLLVVVSIFALPVAAEDGTWKQYLEAGSKALHYNEIKSKLDKLPKEEVKKSLVTVMYSVSSRESIKKAGKYIRAVLTIFRKGETSLPSKEELEELMGSISLIWQDELKEVQELTLNKTKPQRVEAVRKVQLRMQQDHSVLLNLAKKVYGEKDPEYLKLKNSGEKLDASIRG